MNTGSRFAYAQARLQSRYSKRLRDGWKRFDRDDSLETLLAALRESTLSEIVAGLSADSNVHHIEFAVRSAFRKLVVEVASWLPPVWRPSLYWVGHLPELPILRHLLAGRYVYAWIQLDPVFALVAEDVKRSQKARGNRAWFLPLIAGWRSGEPMLEGWREHFHELLPPLSQASWKNLQRLEGAMTGLLDDGNALSGYALPISPETIERGFEFMFRRNPRTPVAVFAFLALAWIELARLRSLLLDRRLFVNRVAEA